MLETLKKILLPRTVRIVDQGNVFCPEKQRSVDIDGCMRCAFLDDITAPGNGTVTAILCTPNYRALAAIESYPQRCL